MISLLLVIFIALTAILLKKILKKENTKQFYVTIIFLFIILFLTIIEVKSITELYSNRKLDQEIHLLTEKTNLLERNINLILKNNDEDSIYENSNFVATLKNYMKCKEKLSNLEETKKYLSNLKWIVYFGS